MFHWVMLAVFCLQFTALSAVDFYVNQTYQIILSSVPDLTKPLTPDVEVWDIDVWDSNVTTILGLQALGKIVVCYFSAGTYEPWRNDSNQFPASDIGLPLDMWPNERWLNIKSTKIREIMRKRIEMAASKGCNAIDPDNTDVDQNKNGLGITKNDAIDYIKFLSATASNNSLKIGLKNSLGILSNVQDLVHFAVNEECAKNTECSTYNTFIGTKKKPVFHIEYPAKAPTVTAAERKLFCNASGTTGMSTLIKNLTLDGWGMFCNGQTFNTSTIPGSGGGTPPPGSSSTKSQTRTSTRTSTKSSTRLSTSTTSSIPTTTSRPPSSTKTSSRTSASATPSPPPGGCTVAHWGQCGGQDYHGCTKCVSGTTCKAVSPPWYYQCL